MDSFVSR